MTARTTMLFSRHRLRTRLRAFCRNDRAATILEFALVSAPFFALIIAILETALVFFAQQAVETAAEAASRLIMTGQAQQNSWSQGTYKTQVCKQLPPFLSCSNLMVDVQTAATFSSVDTSMPTITYDASGNPKTNYTTGGPGSIVIVRLMYLWPIATGPMGFNLSNQSGTGKRLLVSTQVAQTEPYS